MWFLFGVITLISFCGYNMYQKLNASWKGTSEQCSEIKYEYKFEYNKSEISGILIGIDAPEALDFRLKKEGSIDRFFKKIGLSVEHQVGNSEFDDLVYVVSDNDLLHTQMSANNMLVDPILKLFSEKSKYCHNLKGVRCNSGRIWLSFTCPMGFEEKDIAKLASAVIPSLHTVAEQLLKIDLPSIKTWKDPFVLKAAVILAISSGLLINGWVQTMRLWWIDVPFTVDDTQMLKDSALWGVGLVILLMLFTIFWLGKSSRTHLVLIEVFLFGTIGTVLTTNAQVRDLNMELDESTRVNYEVVAHDKWVSRSRRSTSYYIRVDDWNSSGGNRTKIEVDSSFYDTVHKRQTLTITQKEGYFGYRWVESVRN